MKAPVRLAPPDSDAFPGAPHPRETTKLFGHAAQEQALLDAWRAGRLPQAVILGGPEGIGKATLAWRLARFIFAYPDPADPRVREATDLSVPPDHPVVSRVASMAQPDVAVLRREWNDKARPPRHFTEIRVDDVRKALGLFQMSSGGGGWRVCVVDCAEDLNRNSANALLKMIEEPPPRSLFLIVAHKPARVLPTIRSRSRMVLLQALSDGDVARAVASLGGDWAELSGPIAMASKRARGSVRQALRLLDSDRLALAERLDRILGGLPGVDWIGVHALAEAVSKPAAVDEFEALCAGIFDWLADSARARAEQGAARLAPLALVWEKLADAVRETEALNLDKRALVLTMFADLSAATRDARR